jgi:hypothetical protein
VTLQPPQKSQKSGGENQYHAVQFPKAASRLRRMTVSVPWPQLSPMLEDLRIVIDDERPRPGLPIRSTWVFAWKFQARMSLGSARVDARSTRISHAESDESLATPTMIPSATRLYPYRYVPSPAVRRGSSTGYRPRRKLAETPMLATLTQALMVVHRVPCAPRRASE